VPVFATSPAEAPLDVATWREAAGQVPAAGRAREMPCSQLAEAWVAGKALAVLEGNAGIVAAAIRRKATCLGLDHDKRAKADRAAAEARPTRIASEGRELLCALLAYRRRGEQNL
jgi:hypothetical protein